MIRLACNSTDCGMVNPSAFEVLLLTTSSNFVGCSGGANARNSTGSYFAVPCDT